MHGILTHTYGEQESERTDAHRGNPLIDFSELPTAPKRLGVAR